MRDSWLRFAGDLPALIDTVVVIRNVVRQPPDYLEKSIVKSASTRMLVDHQDATTVGVSFREPSYLRDLDMFLGRRLACRNPCIGVEEEIALAVDTAEVVLPRTGEWPAIVAHWLIMRASLYSS